MTGAVPAGGRQAGAGLSGALPAVEVQLQDPHLPGRDRDDPGLNKSTGKNIGIYPEIKAPGCSATRQGHLQGGAQGTEGVRLHQQGDKVYLQCFDANELRASTAS